MEKESSTPKLEDKELVVENFASEVLEEFKNQIGKRSFTLTKVKTREPVVITPFKIGKEENILMDSQVPNHLYVSEPNITHGVTISLAQLLTSHEATALLSSIMNQKGVPINIQTDVKRKIADNLELVFKLAQK